MPRSDDSPDVGRFGAAEVFVYDSRTRSGHAARTLMDLLPGAARTIKLQHVAGMVAGPPPEALTGGLPMLIRYDAESRTYAYLHGVQAATFVLERAKDIACATGAKAMRHSRAGPAIVATEVEAKRVMTRSAAVIRRENDALAKGHFWAMTGSDFQPTDADIEARQKANLAARQQRAGSATRETCKSYDF